MILDTNALSALAEGDAAIRPILERASTVALPSIVLGEYRYGISRSSLREQYDAWLSRHLKSLESLSVTWETTAAYADIRLVLKERGTPIPENDVWIAALAREHGLPILTRDAHFHRVPGVSVQDW